MIEINIHNKSKQESSVSRRKVKEFWPWWKVEIAGSKPKMEGRVQAALSPHVLNLRPNLVASASIINQKAQAKTQLRHYKHPRIDFLELTLPNYKLSGASLWRSLSRFPKLRQLSIFTILEILWLPLSFLCNAALYGFFNIAAEAYAIGREIKADVLVFAKAVSIVLGILFRPLRGLLPQKILLAESQRLTWPALGQVGFFLFIALIITLPFKGFDLWQKVTASEGKVIELAQSAIGNLKSGGEQLTSGNPALAEIDFKRASDNFTQALNVLGGLPDRMLGVLDKLPGTPQKLSAANHLLVASREVSQAAALAAGVWRQVVDESTGQPIDLGARVTLLQNTLIELKPHLDIALSELKKVDSTSLPPELSMSVLALQNEVDGLEALVGQAFTLPGFLQQVLASPTLKHYIVLFQNSSELRPTGGFMGSLAFVEIENGRVKQMQIPGGGPYDFQGSLRRTISPPEPLRLVRGTWQLQDANWFFDFPASARKVLWFLQESGGPEVQGVIALTPDLVIEFLKLTGSVSLPQYDKVLTADNFMRETQLAVEIEYDKKLNKPKQFIADLAPILLQRILELSIDKRVELAQLLERGITKRSLQVYLTEPELQANVSAYGWSGEVKKTPLDYLAVVRTNIGGGKTDAVTSDKVRHNVEITKNDELIVNLEFTRTHQGSKSDIFEQRRNNDYVRFYVPFGSQLISGLGFTAPPAEHFRAVPEKAELDNDLLQIEQNPSVDLGSGTRVTQEFSKTVFAGWLNVAPGETKTVRLSYRLPFTLKSESNWQDLRRYNVYFQRQAGVKPVDFVSTITLPLDWRVRWQEGSSTLIPKASGVEFKSEWMRDEYYGVVLERLVSS
jgi:hypothetical protein